MRLFAKLFLLLGLCAGVPLAILGGAAMWRSEVLRGVLLDSSARTGESSAAAGEQALYAEARRLHRSVVERRASEMSEFFEADRRLVELTATLARSALAGGPEAASPPQWSDAKMAELRKGPEFDATTLGKAPYTVYHLAPGVSPESVRRPLESLARLGDYFAFSKRETPWLKSIYFAHADGFILGYPAGSPFPADYDPRVREWYLKAVDRGRLTWSNFYADKDGKPVITCTTPLLEGGKVVGVAATDVSLEDYLNRLFDLRELPASDALLVNAHGGIRVAASVQGGGRFSWDSWDWKTAPSVKTYLGGRLAPAFAAALKGEGGAFLVDAQGKPTDDPRAARGGDLLSYARRESRTGAGGKYWFYLVRTPADRVTGPVDEVRGRLDALNKTLGTAIDGMSRTLAGELMAAALLAVGAALGAAWLGAGAVSRPLTALAAAVRRIGKGDFEVSVAAPGDDEVAEVGRAVNEMVKGLKEGVFVKDTFKRYLSASVVEQIIKDPSALRLGGEERELTVFFSDMSGFTTLSETMEPRKLVELLNEYLGAMTDSIFLQEGTLDKYEGDAVMAFWGAPLLQPDHARRACWAALDNRSRLKELCRSWEARGLPTFDIRIGINTGRMIVGNVGSQSHMGYTVLGDAVNTGSRLEQVNKHYGTHILVSEATRKAAGGAVEARELDLLEPRGKKNPIRVYELLGLAGQVPPKKRKGYDLYEAGLAEYRGRAFEAAATAFRGAIEALGEDKAASVLLQRCLVFRDFPPPEGWDGVFRAGGTSVSTHVRMSPNP
ncbi:MAG: HAMP domain-containing protein [Elusimicrobia bacterium]|nr:HAMP domain-containing protein [Elusimicrobiota bacterium]